MNAAPLSLEAATPVSPGRESPMSNPPSLSRETSTPSTLLHATATAAEARAVAHREDTVELDYLVDPEERLRFYRCLDQDMLPSLSTPAQKAKTVENMSTLLLLLNNALEKGLGDKGDAKYLQIKLSNPAIRKKLELDSKASLQGKGAPALDWLHLCGWRHGVKEFQEYCSFPAKPSSRKLAELKTGTDILKTRLQREKETVARTEERRAAAKEEEGGRKKLAMLQFKEDRLSKQEKDDRERLVRQSRLQAQVPQPADPVLANDSSPPSDHLKED